MAMKSNNVYWVFVGAVFFWRVHFSSFLLRLFKSDIDSSSSTSSQGLPAGLLLLLLLLLLLYLGRPVSGFFFFKLHRVQPRTDGPIIDDKSFSRSPSQVGLDSDRLWSPFFSLAKWPPNKIEAQNKKNALALLEHRLYRVFCFVFPGTINIVKVSISIYWVLLGFTGFYWVSLEESSTFCLK